MRDYLESFARQFGLYEHIAFGTEVAEVTPRGERGRGGWTVRTADGQVRAYAAVLIANGHLTDPYVPAIAADFTGKSMHSHDYTNIGDVEGDRVLVVGVGNSGCDLVVDAANARLDAHISIRHGQIFQPKAIFGRTRAELTWMAKLPPMLQERITRSLIRIVIGPIEAYRGLPVPVTRNLNEQKPVVNNLLDRIHHGRIAARPGISRIDGRTVHFADGTSTEFDTVVGATGFKSSLPFLDPTLLTYEHHHPVRVGGGLTVPVGLERLYLIGLAAPRGPQLPVYSAQAELVAEFHHDRDPAFALGLPGRPTAARQPDRHPAPSVAPADGPHPSGGRPVDQVAKLPTDAPAAPALTAVS